MKTSNTKDVFIDVSDQLVKFRGNIYKLKSLPHSCPVHLLDKKGVATLGGFVPDSEFRTVPMIFLRVILV